MSDMLDVRAIDMGLCEALGCEHVRFVPYDHDYVMYGGDWVSPDKIEVRSEYECGEDTVVVYQRHEYIRGSLVFNGVFGDPLLVDKLMVWFEGMVDRKLDE